MEKCEERIINTNIPVVPRLDSAANSKRSFSCIGL
jgi:hypothetical protein